MSRTALFVIDIQHALASDPSTQIPHAARIVDAGIRILAHSRALIGKSHTCGSTPDLEIIVVQHEETPDRGNLQRGSRAWELVFPPLADEYLVSKDVRKSTYPKALDIAERAGDTFSSNPSLADELHTRNVGTIVAFGIQSECCVLSTCRGALAAGFKVILLKGAHSTYDSGSKTALEIEKGVESVLEGEGVRVVKYEEWVDSYVPAS